MPWTNCSRDLTTALEGLNVHFAVDDFAVIIEIHDVDPPEIQRRLNTMFRAIAKYQKKCDYGGCHEHIYFVAHTRRDGSPANMPVRLIRPTADEPLTFRLTNHFRDCPGVAQQPPRPAAKPSAALPQTTPPRAPQGPKQGSLFYTSKEQEYPG